MDDPVLASSLSLFRFPTPLRYCLDGPPSKPPLSKLLFWVCSWGTWRRSVWTAITREVRASPSSRYVDLPPSLTTVPQISFWLLCSSVSRRVFFIFSTARTHREADMFSDMQIRLPTVKYLTTEIWSDCLILNSWLIYAKYELKDVERQALSSSQFAKKERHLKGLKIDVSSGSNILECVGYQLG